MQDSKPGFLIAIEGLDRSGKSTQIERVKQWLTDNNQSENQQTNIIQFPGIFRFLKISEF